MKYVPAILLIFILSNLVFSQGQTCDCKADLQFLDSKIKQTPSHKRNARTYEASLRNLSLEVSDNTSVYDCFVSLNRLMLSIRDNHSRLIGLDKGALEEIRNDSVRFDSFTRSILFNIYPRPNIDLDSLTAILESKELADIEGIYQWEHNLTIGVFRKADLDFFQAIILDSKMDLWRRGEVIYTLIPYGKDYLLSVGGGLLSKRLLAQTERIVNGMFSRTGFTKELETTNYATILPTTETYYREELSSEITYLRIGSFSGFNPTLAEAERFYAQLEGTLNKPHLIVDLRNNGGGGVRNSDILFKILKKYAGNHQISVLINLLTASNAEQFTVKLREFDNCQVFGQPSNGTIAYELTGESYELPSGNYRVVLTSKTHSKYLSSESVGIAPDQVLDMKKDWLDQLIKIIENKG